MGFTFTKAKREKIWVKTLLTGPSGCVDADTEFFTGACWKRIADYQVGNRVLQYDAESKKATLCEPIEYHKYPCESLWHIENNDIDQCLSDEHNVLYIDKDGIKKKKQFSEIKKIHEESENGFDGKFIAVDKSNLEYSVDISGKDKVQIIPYKTIDGFKYCFTTPTGNLVLRRNNKTFITGNSGKTFSALRLATGFAKKLGSRVAFIDTENGRVRYYAKEFDFDDLQLEAPYTSEKYIEAIQAAIDNDYKVVCIDSISHEWLWCNELVNSMPGNSFQNWGKVKTQHHNKFAEFLIQCPVHIFATARGKDKWQTEDKNGRMNPRKVGEGSVASDDTEYNYTCTFNISQDNHVASCSKDNTHIFEGRYDVLTEKDGEKLYDWANTGEVPAEKEKPKFEPAKEVTVDSVINEIMAEFKGLISEGVDKDKIYSVIESIYGKKNFREIKDVDVANKVLEAVKALTSK